MSSNGPTSASAPSAGLATPTAITTQPGGQITVQASATPQPLRGRGPIARPGAPCVMVIFGAGGDLTKRLLMPAIYNLACDQLLPSAFAILGTGLDPLATDTFRAKMTRDVITGDAEKKVKPFTTRKTVDRAAWDDLVGRMHYTPAAKAEDYPRLAEEIARLDKQYDAGGNILFYFAVPPSAFGAISKSLAAVGLTRRENSWVRAIIEKPFGYDSPSAVKLNAELLQYWKESQIYRVDHYLGKETVQNLLAFRFSNGMFEPLWNKTHIDHIQFTVDEAVGVEGRGAYYDHSGVLRDMIQNHMFQMLAYLCMEPPASFASDHIRNEKSKLLDSVRVMTPAEVWKDTVRGQYGPGRKASGEPAVGYRQEPGVNPQSSTETFAAMRLFIDNWRWEGVPIYLRSGKGLWKRGTEIVVQFKKAPSVLFRNTAAESRLESNLLIFHIQPDQAIELRFHAKTPGPVLQLQTVDMRFDYHEAFEAARGTGYEVMVYSCMNGDATLFSRTDLVETAWRIAQPMLDAWSGTSAGDTFPNYPAGTWGPKAAYDLIERDGRSWVEIVNREVLQKVPLFAGADEVFLHYLAMSLRSDVAAAGDEIIREGEVGQEMYFIARGEVEVLDKTGKRVAGFKEGDFFGEIALLKSSPRTATVRALTAVDLFVLGKSDFDRVLRDNPQVEQAIREAAAQRYKVQP
jgi:glucose-6-phosphate 1-dehydrogenase